MLYVPCPFPRARSANRAARDADGFLLGSEAIRIPRVDVEIWAALTPRGFDVRLGGLNDAVVSDANGAREPSNELVIFSGDLGL